MQLRRLIPRMAVAWRGLYRLGDEPMGNWRPCSVVDVSTGGAGLELPEGTAEVPPDGESVTVWVELRGTVRTIAPGQRGGVRAGVELVDQSDEVSLLRVLSGRR